MNNLAIDTFELRKTFGPKVALEGLTLTVERGEIFGFLGPNGAGKTTYIKMLLGLIRPTGGSAELFGQPISQPQTRTKIGYLPEKFLFYPWMTGAEFLDVQGKLYGLAASQRREKIPQLLNLVGLPNEANSQLGTFSKGMLQRIGLAQAIIHDPALLFLDEPTSGLDPIGRKLVRDIVNRFRESGTAVFINSHLLSEIEQTCDRVAFIQNGRVLETHRLDQLGEGTVVVKIRLSGADGTLPAETLAHFQTIALSCSQQRESVHLTLSDESEIPPLVHWLSQRNHNIYELVPQRLSLEDRFLSVMHQNKGGGR